MRQTRYQKTSGNNLLKYGAIAEQIGKLNQEKTISQKNISIIVFVVRCTCVGLVKRIKYQFTERPNTSFSTNTVLDPLDLTA